MNNFDDIKAWAGILESEDREVREWNRRCALRNAQNKRIEKREFERLDESQVDPRSLGMYDMNGMPADDVLEDDVPEEDEIDFGQYGLDEADDREVLPAAARALAGREASTADLNGQDSVQLAMLEAIKELTKAVKAGRTKLDEAEIGDLIGKDVSGKLTDMAAAAAKAEDYLTDEEWQEFDDMPEETPKDCAVKWNWLWKKMQKPDLSADGKKALSALQATYLDKMKSPDLPSRKKWDVTWSQIEGAVDDPKEISDIKMEYLKTMGMRPCEAAIKRMKKIWQSLVPFLKDGKETLEPIKGEFFERIRDVTPRRANGSKPYTAEVYVPYAGQGGAGRSEANRGDSAEDRAERAAETGVDTVVDKKYADWTPEQMDAGTKANTEFNPDYEGKTAEFAAERKLKKRIQRDPAFKRSIEKYSIRDRQEEKTEQAMEIAQGMRQADRGGVRRGNPDDKETDTSPLLYDFVKILNGIPKEDRDELEAVLKAEAADHNEKTMIDDLFSDPEKLFQSQRVGQAMGMGTKQDGKTGAVTEIGDRLINIFLVCLVKFWFPEDEDSEEARQARQQAAILHANLRGENTNVRQARIGPRNELIKLLMNRLEIDGEPPQPYTWERKWIRAKGDQPGHWSDEEGWKPNTKDKKRFDEVVQQMIDLTIERAGNEGLEADDMHFNSAFKDYNDKTKIVKMKTGLSTTKTKGEFQRLIAKARDAGLDDDEWLTLITLNLIRRGKSEEEAEQTAYEIMTDPDPAAAMRRAGLDEEVTKRYLRGGSDNANI